MGDHREISSWRYLGCSAHKCTVTRAPVPVRTLISRLPPRKLETTGPLVCFAVHNRRLPHMRARESGVARYNRGRGAISARVRFTHTGCLESVLFFLTEKQEIRMVQFFLNRMTKNLTSYVLNKFCIINKFLYEIVVHLYCVSIHSFSNERNAFTNFILN